jgi:hypothetical protein
MDGPKPIFASGRSRRTAVASTCAALWRSTSSARGPCGQHAEARPLAAERRHQIQDRAVQLDGEASRRRRSPMDATTSRAGVPLPFCDLTQHPASKRKLFLANTFCHRFAL